jgi:DAACS family dicarboxylate/amino acid:cation (Na+ or H+) symporter
MFLHIVLCYQTWIRFFGRIQLRRFWKEAGEPSLYAFGINSSLATLPHTLKALDRLRVTASSSRLSACIGTNFNNDGILLYEVVAALFLVQAYGITLSLPAQILVAFISVVACIGVAGIPEAGIISLTIVLSSIGLPAEAIPFLLTVDWILARMRSFTNVLGDITVAVSIDRITHQGRFSSQSKTTILE